MPGARSLDQSEADIGPIPNLVLQAPLDGWVSSLSEVPDPVFADRMMGDGLAIDPVGSVLCAPCVAEVILLHPARHAVTLRAANGAEILMHIGLDTVALGGRGFTAHVKSGQHVKTGDKLISFDLDQLADAARSLITPIVITNGEDFAIERRSEGVAIMCGEALMTLRRRSPLLVPAAGTNREFRRTLVVPLAHGIHARPAARLADLAKSFASEIAIEFEEKRVNAKSPVALMGLGLSKDARAVAIASGTDAEAALAALVALIESGMGEAIIEPSRDVGLEIVRSTEAGVLTGVGAAPGMSIGIAVTLTQAEIAVDEMGHGAAHETKRLQDALAAVRAKLGAVAGKGGAQSAILAAHMGFLDDPELTAAAAREIAQGKSAGYAWREAIETQIAVLRGLKDSRFAERVPDLVDLERQVLIALGEAEAEAGFELPDGAILLAEDILPSQLVGLDTARLAGIATAGGGPTSHVAILAGAMNIPALVACGQTLLAIPGGTKLLLDADRGRLSIDPPKAELEQAGLQIAARRQAQAVARAKAQQPCHTQDGVRIEIGANLGSLQEAMVAVAAGAEGCGLLRTEFLFLNRQTPPSEVEQTEVYRAIAEALRGRPLIIRTLDIGGDKPAPYLPFPAEENPALGLRGVRVSLWRTDILATQLRAILRGVR